MSVAKLAQHIGKQATYRAEGLRIKVEIIDAREMFGRIDYKISPVNGSGEAWKESGRIDVEENNGG